MNRLDGNVLVLAAPDGARGVTATPDGRVQVWGGSSGATLHDLEPNDAAFPGDEESAWALAISPDGSWIAVAGELGSLGAWDLATGRPLRTFRGPHEAEEGARDLVIGPEGAWLAVLDEDGRLDVWDTETGSRRRVHEGGTPLDLLTVDSRGGELLAAEDDLLRIWDPERAWARIDGGPDVLVRLGAVEPEAVGREGTVVGEGQGSPGLLTRGGSCGLAWTRQSREMLTRTIPPEPPRDPFAAHRTKLPSDLLAAGWIPLPDGSHHYVGNPMYDRVHELWRREPSGQSRPVATIGAFTPDHSMDALAYAFYSGTPRFGMSPDGTRILIRTGEKLEAWTLRPETVRQTIPTSGPVHDLIVLDHEVWTVGDGGEVAHHPLDPA